MRKIKLVLSLLLIAAMMLPLCACGSTVVPVGDLNATVTGSGSVDGFEYNTYSDGTVGITKY
ncbi:MAG: hypothetical protein IKZ19_02900, partial [Clostridia bacterium]|nr:hypothetical protein [Clostridia bacterium]